MTLTEQWKKGELKEGWYYIELNESFDKIHKDISYYSLGSFDIEVDSNYIIEILAPVPSYEEYLESESHCAVYSEVNKSLKEKNVKLKELLKEAKDIIEWYKADCGYIDTPTEAILTKIDNAIGEK